MKSIFRSSVFAAGLILPIARGYCSHAAKAQAPAANPAARQLGTVKAIAGNTITLGTDAGAQVTVTVADGARVLQLAPGSTDLRSAQLITIGDIAAGDRVLVSGKVADDGSFTATRVILMKSSDIAQKHQEEQADWQRRGSGGLVSAVDASTGAISISSGAKKVMVNTSARTQFRRYSGDSVKFEDAKPSTLAQIQTGDQVRVLGDKSEDGASVQADAIVSGTFKNLSGTIASVNAADGTLILKDLVTKKNVTVKVTANSDVRKLPEHAAAMLVARAKGGPAEGAGAGQGSGRASGQGAGAGGMRGAGAGQGRSGQGGTGGATQGSDLSQMLARFPTGTLADLKVGDAVMVVVSQPDPKSTSVTAVTMLSGVEPILAASPNGSAATTLSPWSVGSGAPDAGGVQ